MVPWQFLIHNDLGRDVLQRSVHPLSLSISLGVVCGRSDMLYMVNSCQRRYQFIYEFRPAVARDLVWYPVPTNYVFVDELGDRLGVN
jgi:hypothetical protein